MPALHKPVPFAISRDPQCCEVYHELSFPQANSESLFCLSHPVAHHAADIDRIDAVSAADCRWRQAIRGGRCRGDIARLGRALVERSHKNIVIMVCSPSRARCRVGGRGARVVSEREVPEGQPGQQQARGSAGSRTGVPPLDSRFPTVPSPLCKALEKAVVAQCAGTVESRESMDMTTPFAIQTSRFTKSPARRKGRPINQYQCPRRGAEREARQ